MVSDTVATTGGEWFNLPVLLKKLERSCTAQLHWRGCWHPDECSHDLVTDFVFIDGLGKEGRCAISKDEILVNFNEAKSQQAVLHKFLGYRVRDKKRRCTVDECRFKGICALAEEWQDDETGRRIPPVTQIQPATPEDLLRETQVFEVIRRDLDPAHCQALFERAFGASHAEIAETHCISEDQARQWNSRDRKKLRRSLASIYPERNSDGQHNDRAAKKPQKK
jgi:hypothetical protein